MSYSLQRAMAWSGVGLIVLVFTGFIVARLLPVPPAAYLTADQVADFYSAHPTTTRLGLLLISVGICLLGPVAALTTSLMLRIQGAPAGLAHLQQIGGTGVIIVTIIPAILMNAAAFRPDRNPIAIQALNDFAWLLLVTPIGLFFLQEVPIGVAILMDRAARPMFPRWVGYVNLWVPLTFLPALLAYFFKTGAFAWHGVLVYYLGLATFGIWAVVMSWALLRAVRELAEEADLAPALIASPH
jgi:hypothetical protein